MDNKKLGIMLIALCALLAVVIFTFNSALNAQSEAGCSCTEMQNGGFCPMEQRTPWQTYLGIVLLSAIAALGIYLIFFEKGSKAIQQTQQEIVRSIKQKEKEQTSEEKFQILLKGLGEDERKVVNAVREQDGITQQTLRLRTGLHKSKLSILLDGLEKKGLITRVEEGKTKKVHLKIGL